jgi:hypothetical protein
MDLATFPRFSLRVLPFAERESEISTPQKNLEPPTPHNCDRHKTSQHIEIGSTIYLF